MSTIEVIYIIYCFVFYIKFCIFCYERDFALYLSDNNQADVIEGFKSTLRHLDDLLLF